MNVMPAPAEAAIPPVMSERRVALLCSLIVIMGPMGMALFTPAMPVLVQVFDTTDAAIKLSLSLYFGGFAFAQLVCGPLSDGLGRRPVLIVFTVLYVLGSLISLLSPTIEVLIAARFLQGLGAAAGIAISRAIIRDLYTGDASTRVMNGINILMATCPAIAPALAGISMMVFNWYAVFVLMLVFGLVILLATWLALKETVRYDPSRIRPAAIARSYGTLLTSPYFLTTSFVIAGGLGAVYTHATLLPFVMMQRVGLTPAQFGIGMLAQTAGFLLGSVATRYLLLRIPALSLVPIGLGFGAAGATLTATLLHIFEPTYLLVMGPISIYTFGMAMILPAMSTAGMAPFPQFAGAASALMGFLQMGCGLLGGIIASLFADPVLALTVIGPAFSLLSVSAYLFWRLLPTPPVPVRGPAPGDA